MGRQHQGAETQTSLVETERPLHHFTSPSHFKEKQSMATLPTTKSVAGCFTDCGDGQGPPLLRFKTKGRLKAESTLENFDDAALAKEMNALSVGERERIAKEMCGVADENEESPEFVASCLEQMDAACSKLSNSKRRDLDRAVFLKPSIQNDKEFKLMFLRCENYDPRRAAERLAKYFSCKRHLFGEDKLVKKIALDDLDGDDLEVAKHCGVRVLKQSDRAGRPILFADATRYTFDNAKKLNRSRFHCLMRLLENETVQKQGVVLVVASTGGKFASGRLPTSSEALTFLRETAALIGSIPVRFSSCHYCYDNPLKKFLITMVRASMGREFRLRLQTHFGSATEIRYSLRSFGIQTDGIIVAEGEEDIKCQLWPQYLERQRDVEQREQLDIAAEESRTGVIAFATQQDVLLGRGRSYQEFVGNEKFRELVDAEVDRYKSCRHFFEKTRVLQQLMKIIHASGGRFLKRVEGGWEIAEEEAAMEKMRKYFRSRPGGGAVPAPGDGNAESTRSAKRIKVNPSVDRETV